VGAAAVSHARHDRIKKQEADEQGSGAGKHLPERTSKHQRHQDQETHELGYQDGPDGDGMLGEGASK
jgi:hypothetical protein